MFCRRSYLLAILLVVLVPLNGCNSVTGAADPGGQGSSKLDFSIADVNPDSARYGDAVSPRDYLGRVSAWYFGHST